MLEFINASKTYDNGVVGLDGVSLSIESGEFVSIIGLSGAGKSTMLRTVNRLIELTEGEILVNGTSITKANKKDLKIARRKIGMIFQSFNLVKRSTVQRNVLSGRLGYYSSWRSILGLFTKEDYALVNDALARVNLSDKLHERCDALSGGQQQRVSIARTIVQQANLILADEPVASLDPITTTRVMNDLKEINERDAVTILINVHSVELARQFSTRIIGLRDGKVVFDGTPTEATDEVLMGIYGADILKEEVQDEA
ncbi:phosphonate ABC transporter ATP-binding protein [Erysipelothrix sp. HDW6C]|nr:phosphonate ABC transporter ATP-binding protein [Erysipelothrix sp. HDW6C]QIK70627.1 phosphonate ABC transporter ATP-binding protein [Erysipelothrix sp. HDW6C]